MRRLILLSSLLASPLCLSASNLSLISNTDCRERYAVTLEKMSDGERARLWQPLRQALGRILKDEMIRAAKTVHRQEPTASSAAVRGVESLAADESDWKETRDTVLERFGEKDFYQFMAQARWKSVKDCSRMEAVDIMTYQSSLRSQRDLKKYLLSHGLSEMLSEMAKEDLGSSADPELRAEEDSHN